MNERDRFLQTRIAGQGRNQAAIAKSIGDIGTMVEPTPAVKWSVTTNQTTGVQAFVGQIVDQRGQKWTGRWYGIVHIAATKDGNPSGSGHVVAFTAGTVLATMLVNGAYKVVSDVNGVIGLTVTPATPNTRRYVYAETLGKPVAKTAEQVFPPIYAFLYGMAAGLDYGALPIITENVQNFDAADLADLATFQAAVASKFPDGTGTVGFASLDCETAPVNLPITIAEYGDAGWPAIRDQITAYLDWAMTTYAAVDWGFYKGPSLSYDDAVSLDSTNRDAWQAVMCTAGKLERVVEHCDSMHPELYPRNRDENQEDVSLFMERQMDLCQAVRTASGNTAAKICPFLYLTDLVTGQFLEPEHLAMYFIACLDAGVDRVYIAGADATYTPIIWQREIGTTLTQALRIAGWIP